VTWTSDALAPVIQRAKELIRAVDIDMVVLQSIGRNASASAPRPGGCTGLRVDDACAGPEEFIRLVGDVARTAVAELIMIPHAGGEGGHIARRIAAESGTSVLISRPRRGTCVVAASDLRVERFPVLRIGAELAGRLGTTPVFVHNIDTGRRSASPSGFHDSPSRGRERLYGVASRLGVEATCLVTEQASAATAILDIADQQSADIVAVGVRRGTFDSSEDATTVASLVIASADRSVLVVPLH
jgi:nucleotide-binding universal stress UspA family protein